MQKEKIVIVGAGISGLYLAFLLEVKYDVVIIESRDRIGGRICSLNEHDMGPSWIWEHHQNMLQLIANLDLEIFLQYTEGYALYDTQNKVETFSPSGSIPSARVKGTLFALIQKIKEKLTNTTIILNDVVTTITQNEHNVIVQSEKNAYACSYVISTLPPRLAQKLSLTPPLPPKLQLKMQNTYTWMGSSIKCVIEFETSFWKKQGLSGFMFSNIGPIGEMHDASTKTQAALFGFIHSNTNMNNIEEKIQEQLMRVYKIQEKDIKNIYLVNWKNEKYTSTIEDKQALSAHPVYGIDTNTYSKKILFSSTEFSFKEGGYLEGALLNAQKISRLLL